MCAEADISTRDALPSERRLVQLLQEAADAAQAVVDEHDAAGGDFYCRCDLCEECNGVRSVIEKALACIGIILPPVGSCPPRERVEESDTDKIIREAEWLATMLRRLNRGHADACACRSCTNARDMDTLANELRNAPSHSDATAAVLNTTP